MTYVSWAILHEGNSDQFYFSIVIPALMEELVCARGTRNATIPQAPAVVLGAMGRAVADVAKEACKEHEAFQILFIHADTGGRALEAGMAPHSINYQQAICDLCGFPLARCVIIAPRHETEAWILADREAVGGALGYRGDLASLGLPGNAREAERLVNPKEILRQAVRKVRGRRTIPNTKQIITAIAQRQSFEKLRRSASFTDFYNALADALVNLGCIE